MVKLAWRYADTFEFMEQTRTLLGLPAAPFSSQRATP